VHRNGDLQNAGGLTTAHVVRTVPGNPRAAGVSTDFFAGSDHGQASEPFGRAKLASAMQAIFGKDRAIHGADRCGGWQSTLNRRNRRRARKTASGSPSNRRGFCGRLVYSRAPRSWRFCAGGSCVSLPVSRPGWDKEDKEDKGEDKGVGTLFIDTTGACAAWRNPSQAPRRTR
jgi:hypothetical protein